MPDDAPTPDTPTPDTPTSDAPTPDAPAGAPLPEHLAEVQWIVDALDDKRALDVRVLDLAPLTASLDCFVIASAESQPQMTALEDAVKERMKAHGRLPRNVEAPSSRWVLMDYGGVVVHLMSPDAREFYDLEGLWADAEVLDVVPS
ncbi:MAG: ribosome silencing factor [Trueperaceae bacterium]|nr:ribosome silencing factor [Trueperaceae bacterium]